MSANRNELPNAPAYRDRHALATLVRDDPEFDDDQLRAGIIQSVLNGHLVPVPGGVQLTKEGFDYLTILTN